jgi:glutamate carboxypeptidase
MKKIFYCPAFLLVAATTSAQHLTKIEKQVIVNVEMAMPATVQLLKESVDINSGTFNIGGVKMTGEKYAKELAAMGFTVSWIALPDSLKRAGHLVAEHKGKKGKKLFLIGHLDTVFEPDMPANPFTILRTAQQPGRA